MYQETMCEKTSCREAKQERGTDFQRATSDCKSTAGWRKISAEMPSGCASIQGVHWSEFYASGRLHGSRWRKQPSTILRSSWPMCRDCMRGHRSEERRVGKECRS